MLRQFVAPESPKARTWNIGHSQQWSCGLFQGEEGFRESQGGTWRQWELWKVWGQGTALQHRDTQASFWVKSWGTEWNLWCLAGMARLRRINTEILTSYTKTLEFTWVVSCGSAPHPPHRAGWDSLAWGAHLQTRFWRGRKGLKILLSAREKVKITGLGKHSEQCFRSLWNLLKKTELLSYTIWCNSAAEAAPLSTSHEFGPACCLCTVSASLPRNSHSKIWECKAEKKPNLFCSAQHRQDINKILNTWTLPLVNCFTLSHSRQGSDLSIQPITSSLHSTARCKRVVGLEKLCAAPTPLAKC